MRKLTAEEVRQYPWGFTPQDGYEYVEVADCCGADSHYGHPMCQVVEEPPAGAEPVSTTVLTDTGWKRLWRVPVPAPTAKGLSCQHETICPACGERAVFYSELPDHLAAQHNDNEAGWCCFCPTCGRKLCSMCV